MASISTFSSSEWASWVQAFGSIAAIIATGLFTFYQTRKQLKAAVATTHLEHALAGSALSAAIAEIALQALSAAGTAIEHLKACKGNPEAVPEKVYELSAELQALEEALKSVQLQGLPSTIVVPMVLLGVHIREALDVIGRAHGYFRSMDQTAHQRLFAEGETARAGIRAAIGRIQDARQVMPVASYQGHHA